MMLHHTKSFHKSSVYLSQFWQMKRRTCWKIWHCQKPSGLPKIAKREFLINPQGAIMYHYTSVNTQTHADQVLKI